MLLKLDDKPREGEDYVLENSCQLGVQRPFCKQHANTDPLPSWVRLGLREADKAFEAGILESKEGSQHCATLVSLQRP